MASQSLLPFAILLSSWVFVGLLTGTAASGGSMPSCVQKLLPCEPYLKPPSHPPASCCVPLKEMVADNPQCLCDVLDNPALLKSFNITRDEALQLPKSCGANADLSLCKNGPAAPPANSTTAPPPTTSSNASSSGNSTSTPKASSAPPLQHRISVFSGWGAFCAASMALLSSF